ncbi:MAG: hypothetical protein VX127_14125 [Myxococcota bacterium]|nr:hypothetical protein [Myxococcota bacterium]
MNFAMLAWVLLSAAETQARPALLADLAGPVSAHGSRATIVAVTHDDGRPVDGPPPTVRWDDGEQPMVPNGSGHWALSIDPGDSAGASVSWLNQTKELQFTPRAFSASDLVAVPRVDIKVGEAATFAVRARDRILKDLRVQAREGSANVDCTPGDCRVEWTPSPAPFPRSVPLIVSDPGRPKQAPTVVVVRLAATPSIPVKTETGARVTIEVGGRKSEPQVADDAGETRFRVVVFPGDERATVSLEDALGNRQTSTIVIGGSTGPTVSVGHQGTIIEGAPWPLAWIAATHADGRLWNGNLPTCSGLTERGLTAVTEGLWVGLVNATNNLDMRVSCRVGGGQESDVVVPIDRVRATRLVLQMYPPVLSADIPIAELQAYLVNGVGERLPSQGIALEAEQGTLQRDTEGDERWVRARYDGSNAASSESDVLRATWVRPAGTGGVWNAALNASAPGVGDDILADVRVVDQGGRPLPGVPVVVSLGDNRERLVSDARGWATASFPWPRRTAVARVVARVDGEEHVGFVLRGDRPARSPGAPDLVNETAVVIQPGRVHGVVLNTNRRTLVNDGQTATISVRLEDKMGNLVSGPSVNFAASAGTIRGEAVRPNGEHVALLSPPVGMKPGSIRVTASTDDGRFSASTDLQVEHKVVQWTLGSRGGGLVSANGWRPRPVFGIDYERLLPYRFLYGRVGFETHSLTARETDPVTGAAVDMRLRTFGVSGGLFVRRAAVGVPVWAGARVMLAPYHQTVTLDAETASGGWGWLSPGAAMTAGVGTRVGIGEAFMELDYLFVAAPSATIGWDGPIGGLVGSLGFKLLY